MKEIDEFLLKEYESAQKLTYHVDEMRSKLTQFFIALSGVALATITTVGSKDMSHILLGSPWWVVASVSVLGCAFLGVLFVLIIARLRRTQIEHFHITNNIRQHFLNKSDDNENLWKVVGLSHVTIPTPTRTSGSYFWVLLIMILSSLLFSIGLFLLSANLATEKGDEYVCALFVFGLSMFSLDWLYMRTATFRKEG
ncbi:hypothetical protein [Vibrio vulnificus]|uniref:hypothetical protein n=1 Tax=Vibrio vulnificus TaxID=672 RepID=UPI0005F1724C|nr:hypothetical protein [Vibrio vulnificus]ELP1878713.1 hypothetical protein [Vibrio vulnificus]MCA3912586.1 hypothetical protein [Vibrio vulnificus]